MASPLGLRSRSLTLLVVALASSGVAGGCGDNQTPGVDDDFETRCAEADAELGVARPAGWVARSHCKYAPAEVDVVFPRDRVLTLAITMTAAEYAAMQTDLDELTGGSSGPDFVTPCLAHAERDACEIDLGGGLEPGICVDFGGELGCFPDAFRAPAEWIAACDGLAEGDACTTSTHVSVCSFDGIDVACSPDGGPGGSTADPCAGLPDGATCTQGASAGRCERTTGPRICQVDAFDPASVDDVPADAAAPFWPREPAYFHAELTFDGVRYTSVGIRYKGNNGLATSTGEKKPLRLKLDKWEAEQVAITDQRLYGFQDLSLSPNQTDDSNLHQVLAAEVFRAQGQPAPHAGFVEVTLDTGSGPRLLGLYALTEIPDQPLLERAFASDDGNLYKPDGRGAHLLSFVEASFHKQNNEESDYQDVQAFIAALNASRADRPTWRAQLDARFDLGGFVDFYAVNQAIGNWDTYGGYAHNFFLYGDPATAQLRFMPWDFDLAFDSTGPSDLSLRSFDGRWPLLQAIARDVELATRYQATLVGFARSELSSGKLAARVDELAALIRPAITREDAVRPGAIARLDAGVAALRAHLADQAVAIADFDRTQATARSRPRFVRDPAAVQRRWRDGRARRRFLPSSAP